ncbi:Gag Pol protein [Plakobranchus ocellatus]|uniref:Gag Pol protein n=1 Tax=Plakobranchus ocellatus TaxID=259542 RepID=A0AAV3YP06_9GAST|nr:Gag Pol protein [Plakobranchus ocellatus]
MRQCNTMWWQHLTQPQPEDHWRSTCKYGAIKSFLTDAYRLSEAKKAAMLLDIKELGDSKLSEIMDKMLALLGDHRLCFLFWHIFLRLLPEAIRAPLANSSNISD